MHKVAAYVPEQGAAGFHDEPEAPCTERALVPGGVAVGGNADRPEVADELVAIQQVGRAARGGCAGKILQVLSGRAIPAHRCQRRTEHMLVVLEKLAPQFVDT